jgi:thiol-disulfide isomerase/thioredoxin
MSAAKSGQPGEWARFLNSANQLIRSATHPASQLPVEGTMPSLDGATGWLNSAPLTAAELRGRVVLVNFWTYTCINWLRTLPYLRAWAKKYQDHGLVVLGVHTPEFSFEHDLDNVRQAVRDLGVDYPVAVDNDYAIWNAFANQYWPAFYFVDAQGQIRHHRFGEGDYQMSEMVLQQLLTQAQSDGVDLDLVSVDPGGVGAAADWASLRSPENYLGDERTQNFVSPIGSILDAPYAYAAPTRLALNHWALSGDWTVERQAVALNQAGGRILYRFHARDLHLVMAPAGPGTPARFRVLLDGQPPGAAHGTDVDEQGNGALTQPRLYQLVRQPGPVTDRTFEITFLDPGVRAYAFTFG